MAITLAGEENDTSVEQMAGGGDGVLMYSLEVEMILAGVFGGNDVVGDIVDDAIGRHKVCSRHSTANSPQYENYTPIHRKYGIL